MRVQLITVLLSLTTFLDETSAFIPSHCAVNKPCATSLSMALSSKDGFDGEEHQPTAFTRRSALAQSITTASMLIGVTASPNIASAAKSKKGPPKNLNDEEKIVEGYKRLDYLLTNWEKETTVCNRNDNPYIGCERTPEIVMEYLGYKSMEDPLFRADKTLIRLQSRVPNNPDDEADYQEALDLFVEKAESANGMAFISSWGEANPGGGKDRVAMFIERAKTDVIQTRDSLKTVIRILNLKVD
mmetsp:Transcript_1660/g.2445  ORF Transcript_1660/g.2445 Transcript_1660/m.2445 type:complete len:243 (-) Transcript_1660:145-873(-)